jgi:DNA-binding response OmpR family regulator
MARILIIDDETNIRVMIKLALRGAGHSVGMAEDGREGLDTFQTGERWDLVLLDQRMPGMEGIDVLREIRKRNSSIPVIMITAFGTIDLAVDAMRAGARDFLRKPFTIEILRGAVEAALRSDAGPPSVDDVPITYGMTTLNGFRVESHLEDCAIVDGEVAQKLTLSSPEGLLRECTVVVPARIAGEVREHAGSRQLPGGNRFWQALCEEAVANYLWQHSDFPPDDRLIVEELTNGFARWIDTLLEAQ